ncbi:sigma-E processing peptidase SpoIIGA [Calderihabitans maritimus]|uniref:Sporulation factor SpoIIGA n=1 Tax=Calderihabitans maritimus TaxID=1246530 RepID=A0A1Z5HRI3_9FIRM|nr:sigma-E processing peptidase SpoIIGA [Calderihabitans maritimus]GAW92136.1 sporulation factor SpoIIGA [Calderihabitans maritimus]
MQGRYAVYLDILFFINFFMDYVVLWATSKFSQISTTAGRLAAGAAFGALFSILLFLVGLNSPYYHSSGLILAGKILFPVAMVWAAFPQVKLRRFLQALGYFYLVSFAMGGAMLGAIFYFNNNPQVVTATAGIRLFLTGVRYTWLLAAVAIAVLMGKWGVVAIRKNFFQSIMRVPVIIRFGSHRIPVKALVDTGNQLRDPISKKPVMIVEYDLIKPFLPPALQQAFDKNPEPDVTEIVSSLQGTSWAARLRIIPFTSIGKSKGVLVGFRPDEVIVVADGSPVKIGDVILGVYRKPLSGEGSYRALLHPDLINSALGH